MSRRPAKGEAAAKPRVRAAPDLPVAAYREQLLELLSSNRVVVVIGETGSGKTTQLPQYLLDAEPGVWRAADAKGSPRVAITQPRRMAAVAMARRVADERGAALGGEVGYTIRFEDKSNPDRTLLRYMTDGCLLRECLGDPDLSGYDAVVLDEAHERSLHTDVLFALAKRAVERREGKLRLLITSATLDTAAFSAYFGKCPVLEVPGRTFNVEMHYHPVSRTQRVEAAVNVALNLHMREGPGHILVFLTGMEECEQAVEVAHTKLQSLVTGGKEVSDCLIVPLYGMMRSEDQHSVFDTVPDGCRKLVFTTNIAETSLTVAGVGYVVDSGYCKQKNFNPKTGMESLLVTEVSQVQATQRSGRAGRTMHGKCFRLYSEETYARSLPKVTVPEILRSNLASVTLQMKAMGIQDVVSFDFLEPPDRTRLVRSLRTLFLLGALDHDGVITEEGRRMAQLPLEPQFARCLLASSDLGCLDACLTLVALLSAEGVWYRPARRDAPEARAAEAAKRQLHDPLGDHLTLIRAFEAWDGSGQSPDFCRKHALHHRALRQARDIRGQLREQLSRAGLAGGGRSGGGSRGEAELLLKALCAGFFMQSARQCSAGGGYLLVGENILVQPEADSALEGSGAEWVLYTELVGNTVAHCLMRTVSAVRHEWLRPYLARLGEVDMVRLAGGTSAAAKRRHVEPERDPAELAEEKRSKVASARERYLARKAK